MSMLEHRPLAAKILIIAAIVLGLMIPLSMLRGLIAERTQMRGEAVATVAKGWGGSLTVGGPMLRVPFEVEHKSSDGTGTWHTHELYILADDLDIRATLEDTSLRRVGIYQVPVYLMHVTMKGSFRLADLHAAAETSTYSNASYRWNEARVRLPISDVRSIREFTAAKLGESALVFGPALACGFPGIESAVDLSQIAAQGRLPFSLDLVLAGSQSLAFLPTAATTKTALVARWRDPQFQGAFLPSSYGIDANGIHAQWQVLALNRDFAQSWIDAQVEAPRLTGAAYGMGLYQSVDVYQRSERAVKYARLFIALTFLSFFAWEALTSSQIHPIQYLLIGLSLSTFYLLLIALSEHVPFWLSFWTGAAALAALLGFYVAGAKDSVRLGATIAALMTFVYGLLYLLMLSESYSLLIGAIALFSVLAVIMTATRKVRWERLGA